MDQLLNLGLLYLPNLEEARKTIERYVPSKLALVHSTLLAVLVGGAEYGFLTALLLLLWILLTAVGSAAVTMLKDWPLDKNEAAVSINDFLLSVKAGDDEARFVAVRGAVSASAFLGFAYLLKEPFGLLGLYFPTFGLLVFLAATTAAAKLGYTDRLREAADKQNTIKAALAKADEILNRSEPSESAVVNTLAFIQAPSEFDKTIDALLSKKTQ